MTFNRNEKVKYINFNFDNQRIEAAHKLNSTVVPGSVIKGKNGAKRKGSLVA